MTSPATPTLRERLAAALTTGAAEGRTATFRVRDPRGKAGAVFVRDGRVVDSEVDGRVGEAALFRLLRWGDGELAEDHGPVTRVERIRRPLPDLLAEAERRRTEWEELRDRLPGLEAVHQIDYLLLSDRLGEVPDEVNGVLKLVDGRRTLRQVLEDAPGDEVAAASALLRLVREGLVRAAPPPGSGPPPPRIVRFPPAGRKRPTATPLPRTHLPAPLPSERLGIATAPPGSRAEPGGTGEPAPDEAQPPPPEPAPPPEEEEPTIILPTASAPAPATEHGTPEPRPLPARPRPPPRALLRKRRRRWVAFAALVVAALALTYWAVRSGGRHHALPLQAAPAAPPR